MRRIWLWRLCLRVRSSAGRHRCRSPAMALCDWLRHDAADRHATQSLVSIAGAQLALRRSVLLADCDEVSVCLCRPSASSRSLRRRERRTAFVALRSLAVITSVEAAVPSSAPR